MAKATGTFELASQNWLFYAALIFSVFYGFRLFRMAKAKLSPNNNTHQQRAKKDAKSSQPEVIPEEKKDEEVEENPKEEPPKEEAANEEDKEDQVDVDADAEEKKTK